jgi:hypothetical protein
LVFDIPVSGTVCCLLFSLLPQAMRFFGESRDRLADADCAGVSLRPPVAPARPESVFVCVQVVDPNSAGFDNPEVPNQRSLPDGTQELADEQMQCAERWVSRQAQDYDTGRRRRWKSQNVGEIQIQSNQTTFLSIASGVQLGVGTT